MTSPFHVSARIPELTPEEVETTVQGSEGTILLDVRTKEEFTGASGHLEGALLIPVQELERRLAELEPHRDSSIIAYCRSGHRSGIATAMLNARGFRAFNMRGGILQWLRELRPVTHGDTE